MASLEKERTEWRKRLPHPHNSNETKHKPSKPE